MFFDLKPALIALIMYIAFKYINLEQCLYIRPGHEISSLKAITRLKNHHNFIPIENHIFIGFLNFIFYLFIARNILWIFIKYKTIIYLKENIIQVACMI